ncbi:hypothetical protein [Persephonella sp.]|uniref:hypothetical protein n=1 Tax=Persephonella sp. TaxID=2060922 RepID=UPI0025E59CF7|nr:hypothetical protein [Persephonella sp.]
MISKDLKINVLPEEKKELMDFYEFLLKKYRISVPKKGKTYLNLQEFWINFQ